MRKISGITEIILEKQSAKGEKMRKRILSLTLSFAVLLSSMSMSAVSVSSANVEETAGTQLQTILLDNDGKNLWVTESWGGANVVRIRSGQHLICTTIFTTAVCRLRCRAADRQVFRFVSASRLILTMKM